MRLGSFLLAFFFLISAGSAAPKAKPAAKAIPDKNLTVVAKVFRQADAVIREMWWVVAADRKPSQRSPFGKLHRAVLMDLGSKLTKNIYFRCDRYEVKRPLLPKDQQSSRPLFAEVFETCVVKNPVRIAQWTLEKENKLQVQLYPENMVELMGLGASLINKMAQCELIFTDGGLLTQMSCKDWTQDRGEREVVQLDKFLYEADRVNVMEIKGVILESMNPAKKIDSRVPLTGPITVTEEDLPQPVAKKVVPSPTKPVPKRVTPAVPPEEMPEHADYEGNPYPEQEEGAPPVPVEAAPPRVRGIPGRPVPQEAMPQLPDPEYLPAEELPPGVNPESQR